MASIPPEIIRIGPCTPESLAMLGPLLCLYRSVETHVLSGLDWAVDVSPSIRIDADGPCEALTFFDAAHRPCWQLDLLPDSDYLAWDKVLSTLEDPAPSVPAPKLEQQGWAAIHLAIGNPIWRACALRLHAVPERNAPCRLAAAQAVLSDAGLRAAERIARSTGASFRR